MTEEHTPIPIDQQLDAYIDDQLTPEQRADFERHLAANPELRDQLELQQHIDASITQSFQPQSKPIHHTRRTLFSRDTLFAAAAAVIILASVSLVYQHLFTTTDIKKSPALTMQQFYDREIDEGFTPDWVCETDEEFANTFKNNVGVPMLVSNLPNDVNLLGLGYARVLTNNTTIVFARVDNQPVVLFVDRVTPPAQLPPVSPGYNRFHREIDGIHIYELSPLAEPRLMDHLNPIDRNEASPS